MEIKYRVWCEFEVDGKIETSMESPASWFLLTQGGSVWEYGPGRAAQPLRKEYKKAIPLLYIGRKDMDNNEMCEGDIIEWSHIREYKGYIKYSSENAGFIIQDLKDELMVYSFNDWSEHPMKITDNIYENPELLKKNGD